MSSGRDYDLIVFGFSGYTGKFVAEEVYRLQTEGKRSLTWAVAGRNMDKLKKSMKGDNCGTCGSDNCLCRTCGGGSFYYRQIQELKMWTSLWLT